jgi:hypothetical protein
MEEQVEVFAGLDDAEVGDLSEPLGDESVAVSYPWEIDADNPMTNHAVWARVGVEVVRVSLGPWVETLPISVAEELAEAQVACIEDRGCEPLAVPDELTGDAVAAEPEKDDEETAPVDEDSAENAFQSEFYALNFSWSADWELVESGSPADGQDYVALTNGVSYLYVQTYEFDGDPAECVQATVEQYLGDPAYDNMEPAVDEDGNEISGSRTGFMDAFDAFVADYDSGDGEPVRMATYISCWMVHIGPDAVGRFVLTTPEADLAEQLALFEEIIETISI